MTRPTGWRRESARHSLAARGMKTSCPRKSVSKPYKSKIPESYTLQIVQYVHGEKTYPAVFHPLHQPGQRTKNYEIIGPMTRDPVSRRIGGRGWGQLSWDDSVFAVPEGLKAGDIIKMSRRTVNRYTGQYYNVGQIDRYYRITSVTSGALSMKLVDREEVEYGK